MGTSAAKTSDAEPGAPGASRPLAPAPVTAGASARIHKLWPWTMGASSAVAQLGPVASPWSLAPAAGAGNAHAESREDRSVAYAPDAAAGASASTSASAPVAAAAAGVSAAVDFSCLLSEDLLASVLSHLDVAERGRAGGVCRRWRAAALQPPHSTALMLHVLLHGFAAGTAAGGAAAEENVELRQYTQRQQAVMLDAGASAALLRGPLCGSLRRLSLILEFYVPPGDETVSSAQIDGLRALGNALPPTLLALTVAGRARLQLIVTWRDLLEHLGLSRAPRLESLKLAEIRLSSGFRGSAGARARLTGIGALSRLDLSHPSLKRLSARVSATADDRVEPALRRLPRLESVDAIEADGTGSETLAAFARAGVQTELLEADKLNFGKEHLRLLKPGATICLSNSTLPVGDGAGFPSALAELRLVGCHMTPKLLELLLGRTETYAPRLARLHVDSHCLRRNVDPDDVVAGLQGLAGGTQVEIIWPLGGRWSVTSAAARLVRLLATSPVLARFVHIELAHPLISPLQPEISRDYRTYRAARARALRGMGAAGMAMLVSQGYGLVPLDG